MNILIPDSWLREYLQTEATPDQIKECLSLCGPSIERSHKLGNDVIYDVEVTTNRVDCMGIIGLAREAAAILPQFGYSAKFIPPKVKNLAVGEIPNLHIKNDSSLCHRILALKVENIILSDSPTWLQHRLTAIGLRPINNLVDITNYVMWETGHPTHVFDFDRLPTGKMVIREAQPGEEITTLDDKKYTLVGGEVVIDDGTGQIIDLPSIMGTANSVVCGTTKSALFFIDDVEANRVRKASMVHGIRTQAATLMEKSVDPHLASLAMDRIHNLVKKLFPKANISPLYDIFPHPNISTTVSVSQHQITDVIGVDLDKVSIKNILIRLGFNIKLEKDIFHVTPPSLRSRGIQIPQDVIEEIARIYGYHNIPSVMISGQLPAEVSNSIFAWELRIKTALKYLGFTEIYTYSLVDNDTQGLKLSNPLSSDWLYLRTSLFPSHFQIIQQNLGRTSSLDFFEIANIYTPRPNELPQETPHLIISTTNQDYLLLKGKLEALLLDIGVKNLQPNVLSSNGILYWEYPFLQLIEQASMIKTYIPISPYPPIIEDFNISSKRKYLELINEIKSLSDLVSHIELVDIFQGKLTLRISFHSPEHQLSSDDIAPLRDKINSLNY